MGDRALINQSYGGRQSLLDGEAIQSAMGGAQGSGGTPTPTPTARTGTSPTTYSFVGTGLRQATNATTVSANNFRAGDMLMGMPDWPVTELYLFFPCFYQSTTMEVQTTAAVTLEGAAVWNDAGTSRVRAQIDGGLTPIVIDPAVEETKYGKWVRVTPATPLAAGSLARFTFAQQIANGTCPRSSRPGKATIESSQGGTSSFLATLSSATTYNNANAGLVLPTMAIALGGDGRACVVLIGDSTRHGQDQAASPTFLTDRCEMGASSMALDDNTSSKRLPFANLCIPGWGCGITTEPNSQAKAATSAMLLWAIAKGREINGGKALADQVWNHHGTNSSQLTATALAQGLRDSTALFRTAVGTNDYTITKALASEMLQNPVSTDGYNTPGSQTTAQKDANPNGTRWLVNAMIGGPDGLGDPTAALRADNTFQFSVAEWRTSALDLGSNRDKYSILPFNTTLTTAWTAGSTLVMAAAPALKSYLSVYDPAQGVTETVLVVSVTPDGAGAFNVVVIHNTQPLTPMPVGALVRETWAGGGLHPGPLTNLKYMAVYIAAKVAMGFGL